MAVDSKAFDVGVQDLLNAIDLCFKQRHVLPSLMLVYSTLDVMAALDRPPDPTPAAVSTPSVRQHFETSPHHRHRQAVRQLDQRVHEAWASLKATADELWAWRNGLVHTYSIDSDATRAGTARRAYYCYGSAPLAILRRTSEVKANKAVPLRSST